MCVCVCVYVYVCVIYLYIYAIFIYIYLQTLESQALLTRLLKSSELVIVTVLKVCYKYMNHLNV